MTDDREQAPGASLRDQAVVNGAAGVSALRASIPSAEEAAHLEQSLKIQACERSIASALVPYVNVIAREMNRLSVPLNHEEVLSWAHWIARRCAHEAAQGMSTETAKTLQAAEGEACQPGSAGMRPDVGDKSQREAAYWREEERAVIVKWLKAEADESRGLALSPTAGDMMPLYVSRALYYDQAAGMIGRGSHLVRENITPENNDT